MDKLGLFFYSSVSPRSIPSTISRSPPTEYNQSFRRRTGHLRPRSTVGGWQARNLSNILPTGPQFTPAQPFTRPGRRPPTDRPSASQVFPEAPRIPPPGANVSPRDINNNDPSTGPPPPLVPGGRRRTGRWPWQTRAQTSQIFLGDYVENAAPGARPSTAAPPTRPQAGPSSVLHQKWPWQERAQKSTIFEVLSGQDTGPKKSGHRTYEWDQRQSRLMSAIVHQDQPTSSSTSNNSKEPSKKSAGDSSSSSWPWQERANQSVVFRSPTKASCSRPVNFLWDQRKTRFSVHNNPDAQFSKGSSYNDNYVQWQKVKDGKGPKAAGKPCYKDENLPPKARTRLGESPKAEGGGKRRFKERNITSGSGDIIALSTTTVPPKSPTSADRELKRTSTYTKLSASSSPASKVKGETCMELVPLGYRFSEHRQRV